jgi:hypothetical protein
MFVQDNCGSHRSAAVGLKNSQCRVALDDSTTLSPNTVQPGGSGSSYYTTAAPAVIKLGDSPPATWTKNSGTPNVSKSHRNSSRHSSNEFSTSPAYLVGGFAGGRSTQRLLLDSGDALGAVQLHLQDEHGQLVQPAVLQRLTITAQATAVTPAAISDTQLIGVTSTVVSPTGTSQTISRKHSSNKLVKAQTSNISSINSNSSLAILFNKLQLEGAPGAKFNVTFKRRQVYCQLSCKLNSNPVPQVKQSNAAGIQICLQDAPTAATRSSALTLPTRHAACALLQRRMCTVAGMQSLLQVSTRYCSMLLLTCSLRNAAM